MLFCELRSSLPSMPSNSPRQIDQRPAGGAGIVGDAIDDVDRAVIGRFVDAPAGIELGLGGHDAVLHAVGLVAGRHAEQIAEGPDAACPTSPAAPCARSKWSRPCGFDLDDGDLQPRIGPDQLGFQLAAVVQHDGEIVGVEHVAPGGQDVPFGRDQENRSDRLPSPEAAGAVELDHLGLGGVDAGRQTGLAAGALAAAGPAAQGVAAIAAGGQQQANEAAKHQSPAQTAMASCDTPAGIGGLPASEIRRLGQG